MNYLTGVLAEISIILVMGAIQWQIGRAAYAYIVRRLKPPAAVPLRIVLLACGTAVMMGLLFSFPMASRLPIYSRFFGWLRGGSLLWALSSSAAWLIFRIARLFRLTPDQVDPQRRAILHAAGSVAIAAPFAALGFGTLIERTAFRVREIDIPVPDLHPDLEGLRLVQLSDIHLSPFLSEKEFARVVDAANELRPHVTLVTGDLISMRGDPIDRCLYQISRLRADSGILACMGNHEVYAHVETYTAAQGARLGIPFLRSQTRLLRFGGAAINFAGVDYQRMNRRTHYLQDTGRLIVPGALNVLLSHNPDVFPTAARQGWDFTIAGHTHGGQVNVEILNQDWNVARFYTPYIYGLYRSGRSSIYVTRGIGTIGMPARLGAPPEISVLRLRKA
ncbi:MAG TPA: metallophosphoesterase [Bryobacteraceae bacterium]|nr:metallophosphoesterase [Bryobacteraceae bacterium]